MPRSLGRVALLVAPMLCLIGAPAFAQTTSTSTETKTFEVITVQGNTVVVKLPEGTRELTVPESFRFNVDGKQLAARELRPGMAGTATITTRTTMTPVTVTEVKEGSVVMASGPNLYVRTGGDVKLFTQREIEQRGITLSRQGRPAKLEEFRPGDTLSATIVTNQPPRVVTEQEVQAILNRPAPAATTAAAPRAAPEPAPRAVAPPEPAPSGTAGRALPATAGPLPSIALVGLISLALATGLAVRRRRQES
jgi:hypothetical protein